jgi:peptide/nickel transport system substrate-binding protein
MKRVLVFLLVLSSAAAAFANGATEEVSEKVLKIGVTDNATVLDPSAYYSANTQRVMRNCIETLIEIAPDGTVLPMLAESWEQLDDKTIEFKLRKGVVSHAGFPLDADDVLVTFGPGRMANPGDPGYDELKHRVGLFESVEKIDQYTVRFVKEKPDPVLLQRFNLNTTAIICGDSYKAKNSWEDWMTKPIGFGSYYFDKYKADEYLTIRKFDDYYGEKAPMDLIKYEVVPEMSPRVMGLLSGDYDIITNILPDQFSSIEGKNGFSVTGAPINTIRVLIFDSGASPVLADPRIRLALSYSIDRELINKTIFKGLSRIPNGFQQVAAGDLYIDEFKAVGFDPERAKKLLKDAGYNGEEISYRYLVDYYSGEVATAQILQQMWKDVGLNVKLELKENWDQIETDEAAPGRAIINWSGGGSPISDPLVNMGEFYGPNGWFQKHNMWKSDRFNELLEILNKPDVNGNRRVAFAEMLNLTENIDPPGTYLYHIPLFMAKNDKIVWNPWGKFMDFRAGKIEILE